MKVGKLNVRTEKKKDGRKEAVEDAIVLLTETRKKKRFNLYIICIKKSFFLK